MHALFSVHVRFLRASNKKKNENKQTKCKNSGLLFFFFFEMQHNVTSEKSGMKFSRESYLWANHDSISTQFMYVPN